MTTDDVPLPTRRPAYREVQFDGDTLIAVVLDGDGVAVPVRTVCDVLGLDIEAQSDHLRKHPVLSQGLRVVNVPIGDRVRSVIALVHKWIPLFSTTYSAVRGGKSASASTCAQRSSIGSRPASSVTMPSVRACQ